MLPLCVVILYSFPSFELLSNVDHLWTFYSLGRSHPEEINQRGRGSNQARFCSLCVRREQKSWLGREPGAPAQEEDEDVNRGRRREEDGGERRMWEPAAVPPLCRVLALKYRRKMQENPTKEGIWVRQHLMRALKSPVSTHAVWIGPWLAFECSPFSKIRFREFSSLEKSFQYQTTGKEWRKSKFPYFFFF